MAAGKPTFGIRHPVAALLAAGVVVAFALVFLEVGYWKWYDIRENVWYNNAWAWVHFVNGQLAYAVTQRLDTTVLLLYLYESAYGLRHVLTLRGNKDDAWTEDDVTKWLTYTHFDTLITDPLLGFIGALSALVVFRLFPSDSLLFGPSAGSAGGAEHALLRAAVAIVAFLGGPGGLTESAPWVFARLAAGFAWIYIVGATRLAKLVGYKTLPIVPYALVWGCVSVSYAVMRYGVRPNRWVYSRPDSDYGFWVIDRDDRRPFSAYAVAAGAALVALAVGLRLALGPKHTVARVKTDAYVIII